MQKEPHEILKKFNPNRLKLARELNGLSKKDLAIKLNVTPSAITQFENGDSKPTIHNIIKLKWLLNVTLDFFIKYDLDNSINQCNCFFRSLKTSRVAVKNKYKSLITILGDVVEFLKDKEGIKSSILKEFCIDTELKTDDDIENYTIDLRKKIKDYLNLPYYNLPIRDIVNLLENLGIVIFQIKRFSKKIDAFSTWFNEIPLIFIHYDYDSTSRLRFSLIHELGHLVLHKNTEMNEDFQLLEKQADYFAGSFLLPIDPFIFEFPNRMNWTDMSPILKMKKRWRVSLSAIVYRARQLSIISDSTYKRAYVFFNSRKWNIHEPLEPDKEHPVYISKAIRYYNDDEYTYEFLERLTGVNSSELKELVKI